MGEVSTDAEEIRGTVGVTAVGMFGKGGGWGIPTAHARPSMVTLGGIGESRGLSMVKWRIRGISV